MQEIPFPLFSDTEKLFQKIQLEAKIRYFKFYTP